MVRPKVISLFAGAGGCSQGFKAAEYDVVYASDFNKAAVETYKINFPETHVECKDINAIDFNELLDNLELKPGDLDVLIGGPPCQGFSTAGARFWDDPRNYLLRQYLRALKTIKPKWFLMENVEGLLTTNDGHYVFEIGKAFIELGYLIRIEKVYAQEFGVPQRRKRVIILGNKLGIDFTFPEPNYYSHGRIFRKSEITIKHALAGLPRPASENTPLRYNEDFSESWAAFLKNNNNYVTDHFVQKIDGTLLQRICHLKPGQTMKDLPEELQHPSYKKRAARRVMDGTPSEKRGGPPSGLKRLQPDEPCLTITGAATREFIHPIENRLLTVRECARIQTFPDSFIFSGPLSEKIQQIGNAIPPLLAKAFALHIRKYGFMPKNDSDKGALLGFVLTKSEGLSPALQKTGKLLSQMKPVQHLQLSFFENAR